MLTRKAYRIDFNNRETSWKNDTSVFFSLKDYGDLKCVQTLRSLNETTP